MKAIATDTQFPLLQQAITPEKMKSAFQTYFNQTYPAKSLTVTDCEITRLLHKPGRSCNITYRISGHDGQKEPFDQWFFGKMYPLGQFQEIDARKLEKYQPEVSFWQPISAWTEMNMALYAFPYDGKLPGLLQLHKLDSVKEKIMDNLPRLNISETSQCKEITLHKVKYRAKKSCVLRYELLIENANGSPYCMEFYSKTYRKGEGRYVAEILEKICANPGCNNGILNIPAPILWLEDEQTLWQHAWPGDKIQRLGVKIGWSHILTEGYLPRIAAMIAALHKISPIGMDLKTGPLPQSSLNSARSNIAKIEKFLPEQATFLESLLSALEDAAPSAEEDIPQTLIHGTFKLAQILCRKDQLGLIDFDGVALGDPIYDIAEFVASLNYLQISDSVPASDINNALQSFYRTYATETPWGVDHKRLAFYVICFFMGKIHSSLKRFETEAIENMPLAMENLKTWLVTVSKGNHQAHSL